MKNIGFDEAYYPQQGECEPQIFDETFWANSEKTSLYTSTNIVGYYLRMIKSYIESFDDFKNITVKPAADKEIEENYSDPIIVVSRGVVTPHNVGIMNENRLPSIPGIPLEGFSGTLSDVNPEESKAYSDILTMEVSVRVYAPKSAEVERIANAVFYLLMAASYNVMSKTFRFILGTNPPTLSPVSVTEKHSEVYTAQISWSLDYKNDAIVLIRKNLIKYATITVREGDAERVATVVS